MLLPTSKDHSAKTTLNESDFWIQNNKPRDNVSQITENRWIRQMTQIKGQLGSLQSRVEDMAEDGMVKSTHYIQQQNLQLQAAFYNQT